MVAEVAPRWVLVLAVCGLCSLHLESRRVSEITRVVVAVCGGVMSLIVWDYLRPDAPIFPSRAVPVWAVLFGVMLVLMCRPLVRKAMQSCFARARAAPGILIGSAPLAERIATEMIQPGRYRIVAAVDAGQDGGKLLGSIPIVPSLDAAMAVADRGVDEVMQADLGLDRAEIVQMIAFAHQRCFSYRFIPGQFGAYAAPSTATDVAGIPVLELWLTVPDGGPSASAPSTRSARPC